MRFSELDPYDHVNHAVYVTYFEVARTEALASVDLALEDLKQAGTQIVVSELAVRYRVPATAGDELEIESEIIEIAGASTRWRQRIIRSRSPGQREVLAEAEVRAGVTDAAGRVKRLPAELIDRLTPLRST